MEDDHIKPWHEGGKTDAKNCQMLCKDDNRRKSGIYGLTIGGTRTRGLRRASRRCAVSFTSPSSCGAAGTPLPYLALCSIPSTLNPVLPVFCHTLKNWPIIKLAHRSPI